MPQVVIVDAVRSAVGKRNGGLSKYLAPDLFSDVLAALVRSAGIDSSIVGQVTGGCVSQVGQQSGNVTRSAWLAAGLDPRVGASTIHSQCGSSQQAFTLAYGLVAGGVVDVAVAGGVESMSQVPMASSAMPELGPSKTPRYEQHYEITTQFEAADRIASAWGLASRRPGRIRGAVAKPGRRCHQGGQIRRPDRAGRCAGRRCRRCGHRHDVRLGRRGAPPDDARGPGRAEGQPARPSGRIAHRRHVVTNLRRCVGTAVDERGACAATGSAAPRPRAGFPAGGQRPGDDADRPHPRHAADPRTQQPDASTTSTSSRSTRRSPRSCWRGRTK